MCCKDMKKLLFKLAHKQHFKELLYIFKATFEIVVHRARAVKIAVSGIK